VVPSGFDRIRCRPQPASLMCPRNRLNKDDGLQPATDQALRMVLPQHVVEQLSGCAAFLSIAFGPLIQAMRGRSLLTSV
jgi:hypothetical protein